MCDNRDDDLPKLIKRLNLGNEECKKCRGENGKAVFLLRNDDKPMCRKCFLSFCTHKFRSEFGKTQVVRQGEKLLVGFSGGPSSMAMLKLIKQGLCENEFRKLRFTPVFVHIYESDDFLEEIESALSKSGFPYHLISASDLTEKRFERVCNVLKTTKAATALKTTKNILLRIILTQLAVKYGCSRVLMANNCTRQSVRVLSNIGQGSGSSEDTAFHDTRHGISILQPLRQFSAKEIAFINRFYDNSLSFVANEETGTEKTHSIDRLTEGFVASLTSDFPSTIFTISKTAEKMTNIASDEDKKQCRFCGNCYKCSSSQTEEATAANAMAFSYQLLRPINAGDVPVVNGVHNDVDLCFMCQSIQDEINMPLID